MSIHIVAVDTGNKLIKTPRFVFNAGLAFHGAIAPPVDSDALFFNGSFYTVGTERNAYILDKTEDEQYFILSLFAIAKELELAFPNSSTVTADVCLAVGLPPAHFRNIKNKYKTYFTANGNIIPFRYNNKDFHVRIVDVKIYPQGFAAAALKLDVLKQIPRCFVIDIGGFTTDILLMTNGRPDMGFCRTLDFGVIHLMDEISKTIYNNTYYSISEPEIEAALENNPAIPEEFRNTAIHSAQNFAITLSRKLAEKGIDLRYCPSLFVGGGSLLLNPYIATLNLNSPMFFDNVCANAIGYEALAYRELSAG